MSDPPEDKSKESDQEEFINAMWRVTEQGQRLVGDFLAKQAEKDPENPGGTPDSPNPPDMDAAFEEMTLRMLSGPEKLTQSQMALCWDFLALWRTTAERMQGKKPEPVAVPDKSDMRFKDPAWTEDAIFDFIKQSYLLTSRWILSTVREAGAGEKTNFVTRQLVNAMSPSNFAATNPEVLRETLESGGENFVNGLKNMIKDMDRETGALRIKMTDESAFQVGENIAATPGKVVARNDLMELIQYAPAGGTAGGTARRRPLLIVPPWINKYYILDLSEKNSFIKWAVEQGNTTFVISWVNPGAALAGKTFDDYMLEGPLAALDAIGRATAEKNVNAVGYCIGGTLLASALAWMAAKGDKRIKSATFLATMLDFAEPGELGVFIDGRQVSGLEEKMAASGYLEGADMANVFNLLRENDLIWPFYINNYLLGKTPAPFDLLYWNSDSTRMPAAMHGFYLRQMYLENKLVEPGGIALDGVPIDLRKIKTPSYILSTHDDHIAPWKSTFSATNLYSGPTTFVLSASGHIAGVVNPPARDKYCYWTNGKKPKDPGQWLETASKQDGSWWPHWDKWVKRHSGGTKTPARIPGKGGLKALCDAPGTYVKMR